MTRPLCRCPASKWPHVHVPVSKDELYQDTDDSRYNDPRTGQASEINAQRYERKRDE